ncbi:hypothetical protein [Celerinatantimonas yamalensis]|uniref:Uncharacterized protein n=1 Tax=Celerinatantimonas yamalensis TaxID=559956 RepID=A0ABW9GB04_9GAMM
MIIYGVMPTLLQRTKIRAQLRVHGVAEQISCESQLGEVVTRAEA